LPIRFADAIHLPADFPEFHTARPGEYPGGRPDGKSRLPVGRCGL